MIKTALLCLAVSCAPVAAQTTGALNAPIPDRAKRIRIAAQVFGAFLEGLPALIIFTPILFPIARHFSDINPLHYGILMITALGIGLFLPPMGIGFLIACALGQVNVAKATRAYTSYFIVLLIGALIVAFVPWFTLVLPRIVHLA